MELLSLLSLKRCLEELFSSLILITRAEKKKSLKINNLQNGKDANNLVLLRPRLFSPTFQRQIACLFELFALLL